MEKEINVIHLHVLYNHYYTGVDRYLDMYEKGIHLFKKQERIKIHRVFLTNNAMIVFPQLSLNANGELSATIPLPQNSKLLFQDSTFWKDKYIGIILDILAPYFEKMPNLIIQCHNLFLSNLSIALQQRFGGKTILHLHCLPWKFKINDAPKLFNRLYQLYENKDFETFREEEHSNLNYALFDKIICLSESTKDYLINIHQIDIRKTEIIYNGLADDVNIILNKKNTEEVQILYVGKISKDKGTFALLDACNTVKDQGYVFKVILAGSCPKDQMNDIKSRYSDLNISYEGQVEYCELQKMYATCTFGVIPSLHEQCSYVAIEMAMHGLPVLVSKVDALAEMFEDGKTALFTPLSFDPDFGIEVNKASLTENVIRLIEDKKLRMDLSRNVRRNYEKSFTLEQMIKNTIDLYEQLI